MDDLYPRYDVFTSTDPVPEGDFRIAHRVSRERMEAMLYGVEHVRGLVFARPASPPRFRIKVATWPTDNPIVLADSARPAFRGQYRTLEAACAAMDNTIRRERNMPARIGGLAEATKRYLDAKAAAREVAQMPIYDEEDAPTIAHHVGQHVQGCRACYAYTEGRVAGRER